MNRLYVIAFLLIPLLCGPEPAAARGSFVSNQAFNANLATLRMVLLKAPAGAATLILSSSRERDLLLELLRDSDPAVRIAALRAMKNYVGETIRARGRVLGVYENSSEDVAVRFQAAKTLSFVAGYHDVRGALLDTARDGSEEPSLRAISYKALYTQVAATTRVRDRVLDGARYESDAQVRRAAIWALFAAAGGSRVRDRLTEIARYDSDPMMRVEALKSLYGAMGHSRVASYIRDIARDSSEEVSLRRAAVLLLSADNSSRSRDILKDMARYQSDTVLRQAAIQALNPGDERLIAYFHLARRTDTGHYIDPLEKE